MIKSHLGWDGLLFAKVVGMFVYLPARHFGNKKLKRDINCGGGWVNTESPLIGVLSCSTNCVDVRRCGNFKIEL